MFTWICPQCGREVPPSYSECPDCAKKAAGAAAVEQTGPEPPSAPEPPAAPSAPTAPPPSQVRPSQPAQGGLPTWLLAIVFAFAFLGLGAGIYWGVGYLRAAGKPAASVESPTAQAGVSVSPIQKHIEISGVRFLEDSKKKLIVRFVVTNHSGAEIAGLTANVTVWGRTQKSEEEAAGTFTFTTDLKPFESRDLSAALNTRHKIYELPDWQNVSADLQVTAPGAP